MRVRARALVRDCNETSLFYYHHVSSANAKANYFNDVM